MARSIREGGGWLGFWILRRGLGRRSGASSTWPGFAGPAVLCVRAAAGGLAAEGSTAGLRVRHLPPAGVGDRGNSFSSDADGSDEVVSCRLSDGSRQAWRLGQISAAGTGGGVPDGVDHGAQVAPWAERGSGPSAARVPRGG